MKTERVWTLEFYKMIGTHVLCWILGDESICGTRREFKECNCQQDAMNEAVSSRSFWEAIRAVLGFKGRYFEWMCFYLKSEYTHCNVKEKWHKGTLMTAAPTFFKVCDPFIPHYTLWKENTVVSGTLQYGHLNFQ